jgi:copper(I)-binding protein
MNMNHKLATSVLGLALLFPVACGDDNSNSADTSTTQPSAERLSVDNAWARTSPASATVGAAYFTITGGPEADKLTGVSVDSSVAAKAEIHEMVMVSDMSGSTMEDTKSMSGTSGSMEGDSMDASMDATGSSGSQGSTTTTPAMKMQQVESVEIPAGEMVAFTPGGYHVMLLDLVKPLATGESIKLDLQVEKAGTVEVTAEVKDAP